MDEEPGGCRPVEDRILGFQRIPRATLRVCPGLILVPLRDEEAGLETSGPRDSLLRGG